jgi:hypothetical protein
MEKCNTDKITSDRSDINLENPSSLKVSLRNSEGNQKLLDKDSSSEDIMRSISPPNEKDACIGNLSGQQ